MEKEKEKVLASGPKGDETAEGENSNYGTELQKGGGRDELEEREEVEKPPPSPFFYSSKQTPPLSPFHESVAGVLTIPVQRPTSFGGGFTRRREGLGKVFLNEIDCKAPARLHAVRLQLAERVAALAVFVVNKRAAAQCHPLKPPLEPGNVALTDSSYHTGARRLSPSLNHADDSTSPPDLSRSFNPIPKPQILASPPATTIDLRTTGVHRCFNVDTR
ncbi:unnamed protein product [Pleuronectes platessa]|uniref:Uncharacterized protein n=1 Tax=Pleuronectes platessa TaxID=8262 RepID=A0A9N7VWK5_PLEPL|nr:unnamed protein product [Pleuronectes platessa]